MNKKISLINRDIELLRTRVDLWKKKRKKDIAKKNNEKKYFEGQMKLVA